jgi:DNA polymerase III subunit delta'
MLFSEIFGQNSLKQQLKETVLHNRVAHAQLFYGNQGNGKLALAIAYAQFINCRDKDKLQQGDSCGKCPSCNKYNKLIHPDLHFVFPVAGGDTTKKYVSNDFIKSWRELLIEKNYYITLSDWHGKIAIERKQAAINVAECNKIISTLSYSSYESEYKVMIIWMVEKLNYAAAPRLLKILEEPPDKTLFLLIAEQTDLIISTILSRLLPVKVPRIEAPDLVAACEKTLGINHNEASQLAMLSNGSLTEALRLSGQSQVRRDYFDKFVGWMRQCWSLDMQGLSAFSDQMAKESRETCKSFLRFGLEVIRNCLLINYTKDALVKTISHEKTFYVKFAPFINHINIASFVEEYNKAIYHIERNVHTGMVFFDLSLNTAKLLKTAQK